ncbi:hypothetical protein [Thalassiella azotivora]
MTNVVHLADVPFDVVVTVSLPPQRWSTSATDPQPRWTVTLQEQP